MMAGSFALIFDPIFQGMAISLLFGPVVSTSLTLLVVPLGCLTAHRSFHCELMEKMRRKPTDDDGRAPHIPGGAGDGRILPAAKVHGHAS
jgi:hypothetical protein